MADGLRLRRETLNEIIACCFVLKHLAGDEGNEDNILGVLNVLFKHLDEVELDNPVTTCIGYDAVKKYYEERE